jgi:hypothetical protein
MISWSFPFSIRLRASCLLAATMLLGASRAPAQNTNIQGSIGLDQAQTQSQLIDSPLHACKARISALRPLSIRRTIRSRWAKAAPPPNNRRRLALSLFASTSSPAYQFQVRT